MSELTEHQQKTIEEIRQHLYKVKYGSEKFISSLCLCVSDEYTFQKYKKNKFIIFSLDELRTLIKLFYKLFEIHEEV